MSANILISESSSLSVSSACSSNKFSFDRLKVFSSSSLVLSSETSRVFSIRTTSPVPEKRSPSKVKESLKSYVPIKA